MQKKLVSLVAAGALGVSSLAVANVQQPDFYVGAQMGHMDTSVKTTYSDEFESEKDDGTALTGFTGGLFAGLKYNLNNDFFLGAEANVQFSDANYKNSETSPGYHDSTKAEINTGWGVGVLGGVNVTPATSFYGRVGYQETKFKIKGKETLLGFGSESFSKKKTFSGVHFGVGSETALTDQLAVRLEWTRTHYSSETIEEVKLKPTENLVQVGLKFSF